MAVDTLSDCRVSVPNALGDCFQGTTIAQCDYGIAAASGSGCYALVLNVHIMLDSEYIIF